MGLYARGRSGQRTASAKVWVDQVVVLFVLFSLFIRRYEEPRLAREFGEEYAAYMQRVGRWLPRRRWWERN